MHIRVMKTLILFTNLEMTLFGFIRMKFVFTIKNLLLFFKISACDTNYVPAPSLDDLMAAVCPTDKPHKCLPHGVCYGKYYYCSSDSKTAEPCISETILLNPDSRKQLCRDIANGKNITELIRHEACNLKADCFEEFETRYYATTTKEDSAFPWWGIVLGLGIAVILLFIAALYFRKKAKRSKYEREQHRILFNKNDREDVDILTNNRMNESLLENGNQRHQSADPEPTDTGNNTEHMPLVRREGDDADNARNPPDAGRTPDPAAIHINRDASSGSVNNRNSNHSSGNSSASFGSEPPEENQSSTFPNRTRREDHPAEVENRIHRAVHMASSEPSGATQVVTNHTGYDHRNNGHLE